MLWALEGHGWTLLHVTSIVRPKSAMYTGNEVSGRFQARDGLVQNISSSLLSKNTETKHTKLLKYLFCVSVKNGLSR